MRILRDAGRTVEKNPLRRGNLEDIEGRRRDCGEREQVRRGNLEERDAERTVGKESR